MIRCAQVVSAAAALSVAAASWAGPAERGGLPLSVAAATVPGHAHDHGAGSTPASRAELRRLVAEGEDKLSRGDAEGARAAFDQAGLMAHEADIELGVLRSQMQAGQYRQALAFAAHTAGVHLDEVEGAPTLFRREPVVLTDQAYHPQAYFYQGSTMGLLTVAGGEWPVG